MRDEYLVLLRCGHWFIESRPDGMLAPRNGETRACAHPDHYPKQYSAAYIPASIVEIPWRND